VEWVLGYRVEGVFATLPGRLSIPGSNLSQYLASLSQESSEIIDIRVKGRQKEFWRADKWSNIGEGMYNQATYGQNRVLIWTLKQVVTRWGQGGEKVGIRMLPYIYR